MLQFAEALLGLYVAEETEGQGLVEYALIIAFIAVVVIVAMVFLQGKITTLFSQVGNSLTSPVTGERPAPRGIGRSNRVNRMDARESALAGHR